jgi:hypothetical protein
MESSVVSKVTVDMQCVPHEKRWNWSASGC